MLERDLAHMIGRDPNIIRHVAQPTDDVPEITQAWKEDMYLFISCYTGKMYQ